MTCLLRFENVLLPLRDVDKSHPHCPVASLLPLPKKEGAKVQFVGSEIFLFDLSFW